MLKRGVLTKVAQELKEHDVPRQVAFTHAAKHAQIRLEQRKEAFRAIRSCTPTLRLIPPIQKSDTMAPAYSTDVCHPIHGKVDVAILFRTHGDKDHTQDTRCVR